jgi:hypothetical protein
MEGIMAYQGKTASQGGENRTDPTRAGRPVGETYKSPKLDRGSVVIEKKDAAGKPLADSNYGRNQNAVPSSVGVEQSTTLTDFDISPKGGDPVRASLIANGFGDRSGAEDSAVADLQRKIDITKNVPDAFGMSSNAARQHSRNAAGAVKVPPKTGFTDEPPPSIDTYKK